MLEWFRSDRNLRLATALVVGLLFGFLLQKGVIMPHFIIDRINDLFNNRNARKWFLKLRVPIMAVLSVHRFRRERLCQQHSRGSNRQPGGSASSHLGASTTFRRAAISGYIVSLPPRVAATGRRCFAANSAR